MTGKLLLEIARNALNKIEVDRADEEAKPKMHETNSSEEGVLFALIGNYAAPKLSQTFIDSIAPPGVIATRQSLGMKRAIADSLEVGEEALLEEHAVGGAGLLNAKWLTRGVHQMVWKLLSKVAGRVMNGTGKPSKPHGRQRYR